MADMPTVVVEVETREVPARSRILARIIGGPSITIVRDPHADGLEQIDARWWPGRQVTLVDDRCRMYQVRCIDWFQPFGDPALTIYIFERTT